MPVLDPKSHGTVYHGDRDGGFVAFPELRRPGWSLGAQSKTRGYRVQDEGGRVRREPSEDQEEGTRPRI